jgi:hypothetical protein
MISLQFFFRECFFVIFLKKTEQKTKKKNEKRKTGQKGGLSNIAVIEIQ